MNCQHLVCATHNHIKHSSFSDNGVFSYHVHNTVHEPEHPKPEKCPQSLIPVLPLIVEVLFSLISLIRQQHLQRQNDLQTTPPSLHLYTLPSPTTLPPVCPTALLVCHYTLSLSTHPPEKTEKIKRALLSIFQTTLT